MQTLSLRPYHGDIVVAAGLEDFKATFEALTKLPYPYSDDDPKGGRYIQLEGPRGPRWLIWGADGRCIVHELTHVLLHTFGTIGHNPTEGDGEPFCYMLSTLMDEIVGSP